MNIETGVNAKLLRGNEAQNALLDSDGEDIFHRELKAEKLKSKKKKKKYKKKKKTGGKKKGSPKGSF